ncbi:hypothetical protein AXK60_22760 [Tsukamurella pseudospumae]|uniref:Uncharacterized protein n=1 Tax=Tsukamurella pseudospumae TaxID=239498 RepID=A0A138AU08_9ACTN|nr:hypothetical protein AXK60_22760 [Tsukamurella pseudospumae]
MTCKANPTAYDVMCRTATGPTIATEGATIKLRAGDVVRFPRSGEDRVCAIGGFLRDSSGQVWAVSGAECAVSTGGVVRTADGYKVGTVEKVVRASTTADAFIPLVKLDPAVKGSQEARSIAAPSSGAVTALTPHGSVQWAGISANALTWRGPGAAPKLVAGDAGSPVTQNGALVGLIAQQSNVTDSGQMQQVLAALGSGAQLAT